MKPLLVQAQCGIDACCTDCARGKFRLGGAASFHCESCPSGFFQDKTGRGLCERCPRGWVQPTGTNMTWTCTACPAGWFNDDDSGDGQEKAAACTPCEAGLSQFDRGAFKCDKCSDGHFSFLGATTCSRCPKAAKGVQCRHGLLELEPGYWSPAATRLAERGGEAKPFGADDTFYTYECLAKDKACNCTTACVGDETSKGAEVFPATAFNCTPGHIGVLCASCVHGFFFTKKRGCQKCTETHTLSDAAVWLAVGGGTAFVVAALMQVYAHRHSKALTEKLHGLRRLLHVQRKRHRSRARRRGGRVPRLARLWHGAQAAAVHACHALVRSAKAKRLALLGESTRSTLHFPSLLPHTKYAPVGCRNLVRSQRN